jgi:hypothetical protein
LPATGNKSGEEQGLADGIHKLEKDLDMVPRQVVWWALRSLSVDERIVSVIKTMYDNATSMMN